MDNTFSNVGNHGDKVGVKVHDEIRDAQRATKDAGAAVGKKVDSMVGQAQDTVKQGINTVKDAVQKTRDSVSGSSDALIAYTQENPVKALMIAAVSGAVFWTLLKAIAPSRD